MKIGNNIGKYVAREDVLMEAVDEGKLEIITLENGTEKLRWL